MLAVGMMDVLFVSRDI